MDNLNLTGITISESNGYGKVQYGSSVDYSTSTVKQVVDAWKNTAVASGDTATARLITYDELEDNLGYDHGTPDASWINVNPEYTPSWVYNSNYSYWTMSRYKDSSHVWNVTRYGNLDHSDPSYGGMVRPVLELSKSANITMAS